MSEVFWEKSGGLEVGVTNWAEVSNANIGRNSGKWYWEVKILDSTQFVGNSSSNINIGIAEGGITSLNSKKSFFYMHDGKVYPGYKQYTGTYNKGDVIGVALDIDGNSIEFFKNNTSIGSFSLDFSEFNDIRPSVNGGGISVSHRERRGLASFTEELMKYSPPEGYLPYGHFEKPPNKTLILLDNEYGYYTEDKFISLGTTYPTKEQFEEFGMEDLSILDRKVQPIPESPISMTDEGSLGEGKVFKASVDLKKYFDLRKLEVK